MDENALGFASYWRNSLADAESGKGSFERKDAKNFTHWHGISVLRSHGAIHHEVRRHILWHLIYLITDVMHRRATVRTWITVTGPNLRC